MPITTPTLWRTAAQVNTTDAPEPGANAAATNIQSNATVTALAGGGYLVAWEDGSTKFAFGLEPRDIVGQIYDALGNRVGGEFVLSGLYSDLDQKAQDVAAFAGGGFAAAYQTTDGAGAGDGENITVEIFDATGNRIRFDDFRQGFGGPAGIDDLAPAIAAFSNGGYVLAYASNAAGNFDIAATIVDSTGVRGTPIAIETGIADASATEIAVLANQTFAIVYQSANASADIAFAIRTAAGAVVADGTVAGTADDETAPVVAALTGGGFAVAWTDSAGDGAGNAGIKARLYTAAGLATGIVAVNTLTAGAQDQAAITALQDGGFVVAWHDAARGTTEAQRLDASGAAIGVQATIGVLDAASEPALALLGDGRFVSAFTNTDVAADQDVQAAIWDPRSAVTGTALADFLTSRIDGALVSGLGGNDTLYGGAGADTLEGGAGNDTYLNAAGDSIVEGLNQGTDTVSSATAFSLEAFANVERLFLTGTAAVSATGNALANQMLGNDGANTMNGLDGNDTINAGGGADTINGGAGADRLMPGLQRDKVLPGNDAVQDIVVFTLIGESTGQTRDVLTGMDFNAEDKIDIPVVPTAFARAIGTGTLNLATFNQNLVSVINAAALPAGHAILFNPSAGDQDVAGMVYLIVDANGIAGYQANQDWVFQLENHTGGLDTTDFI